MISDPLYDGYYSYSINFHHFNKYKHYLSLLTYLTFMKNIYKVVFIL